MAQKQKRVYSRQQYKKLFKPQRYTKQTVIRDREYGLFWYDWLWQVLRPVLMVFIALLLVAGVGVTAYNKAYDALLAPANEKDTYVYSFTVNSGDSVTAIGRKLENEGFIRNSKMFKYYVQFYGLTNRLQSGVYDLKKNMSLSQVASVLSSGEATNERTIRVIPGWNVEDIADYLVQVGAITEREDFLKECQSLDSYMGYSIALINASSSPNMAKRPFALEGYLAPDTYRVYLTADAADICRTLVRQMDNVYNAYFDSEATYDESGRKLSDGMTYGAKGVTLSEDEVLILASIIEKEASSLADMRRVSAVFYNRLAAGMRLQSDPTVKYMTGITRLALTNEDIRVNTPYNTYVVDGLPAGPICSPSKNAISAAINPDENYLSDDYLYFCAGEPGTGTLIFARTSAEHDKNVAVYRPLWEAYDRRAQAQETQAR
ncbi:MAG: endolytic transglycosylase MltG [Clostridia bacterium]|nr:endolytic transglycosylase MltG [Clostridia bacterium]MBR5986412.1 endolytic transglycosylase MltG [Clostridia bacterium]MBR6009341.1 endolytic transglycosylase MltG [Clostridia bacterium]